MNWCRKIIGISLLFIISLPVSAQLIDNTSTFRNIQSKKYLRFSYDNDFFTKTDYYYTQGITIEYVHPRMKNFALAKLLIKPGNSENKFGVTANLFGYTPTSISSNAILYGDRPYQSALSIKTFITGSDTIRQHRLASAISIGVFGPLAQGEEMQTIIHRWVKNKIPRGWDNQIQNDVIINYQLNYEKKLVETGNGLLINGAAEARMGTLHDRIGAGINFMAGHFNDPYSSGQRKKIEYYLYGQSRVNFIGYDATMQGGIFNRKSPYTIRAGDISRITFQADAGIILNFRNLYFSYTQSFLTKEFETSRYHRWGGVSFGFSF